MADEADLLIEAGFSDAKLARESAKVIGMFRKAGTDAEKAFQSAVDAVSGSQKVKATAREIETLKKQFDPLYSATKRYEAEVEKLNRLQAAGGIGAKEYGAALGRLKAQKDAAASSAGKFGGALGNVGFQIGDFATQVGAGTSATQALGQQLPQLLGAFGTFGALAGAAAAVMIPLGSALVKTAFDSETLEERMKALSTTTDAYTQALEAASTPLADLEVRYGSLAGEIQNLNQVQLAYAAAANTVALKSFGKGVVKEFGGAAKDRQVMPDVGFFGSIGMGSSPMLAATSAISEYERAVQRVRKEYKLAEPEARAFVDAAAALSDTTAPKAQEAAIRAMMKALSDGVGGMEKAAEAFGGEKGIWGQLREAHEAALKQIENRNQDLLNKYDQHTQEMKRLAGELDEAEAERAKASAAGKAEEVAQWDRVIAKIREAVQETRAAANETDAAYQKMSRAYQQYGASRREGAAVDQFNATALAIGREYTGMKERPNREELKNLVGVDPATVAWCAAFMNAVLDKAGGKGTGSLSARSFLNWGTATDNPGYGDVVVLKRGRSSSAGHVGFYEGMNPDGTIRVFGGNQSNGVGTANFKASDVLGYRRAPAPGEYVDPQTAADAERIAIAGERAAEAEKEQKRLASENAAALKKEVAERERKAEAMQKAREAMSESLVSQQKAAELERQRADQIAAINAGPGSDAEKAAAIAQVNAEMQRQITIMALMEEAKRRQVDIDTLMVGSTMTYRQAIEALGETAKQRIIADQQMQASAQSLAEAQAFANQQMQSLQDGFIDAIIAGESFADVLKNVAAQMAKAWAQAALFGNGPLASQGGGGLFAGLFKSGGLLSQVFGGFRASGGPVSSGRAYVVGERGPEIIVPRAPGQVIPNHKLVGTGGSMSMVIDLRGTTGDDALDRKMQAAGARILAQAKAQAPGWVADHNKRTG